MTRYNICNHYSGEDLGTYEAENENAALDAMARDAGYEDYAEVVETCGRTYDDCREEMVVTEATAIRVEPRFTVGDKIIAGDTDDEREDGTIIEIDGDRALIAWRQGTRTWIDLDDCEAV